MSAEKVIGIILKGYPGLSETFIINEILLLEKLGHRLHIFALRDPGEATMHERVRQVRAPVTYIPDYFWPFCGAFMRTNIRLWWRRPGAYWHALCCAVRSSVHQRSTATIKRFIQAAYLVEKGLPDTHVTHVHAHFSHDPTTVAFFVSWLTGMGYSVSAHAKDIYLQETDFLRLKIARARFVVTCTRIQQDLSPTAGRHGNTNTALLSRHQPGLFLCAGAVTCQGVSAHSVHWPAGAKKGLCRVTPGPASRAAERRRVPLHDHRQRTTGKRATATNCGTTGSMGA